MCLLTTWDFQCGHVISRKNGGEAILENLRPICHLCNMSMSFKNWYEFEYELYPSNKKKRSTYDIFRKKPRMYRFQFNWNIFDETKCLG